MGPRLRGPRGLHLEVMQGTPPGQVHPRPVEKLRDKCRQLSRPVLRLPVAHLHGRLLLLRPVAATTNFSSYPLAGRAREAKRKKVCARVSQPHGKQMKQISRPEHQICQTAVAPRAALIQCSRAKVPALGRSQTRALPQVLAQQRTHLTSSH